MTEIRTEVAVVGLGAMGAATLFQLAKRGIPAVGIDRHPSPHVFGSSHGESRITRCAVGEGMDYAPLALASHRIWREIEAETGEELLDTCGCLVIAVRGGGALMHGQPDFVQGTIASAEAARVPHERLETAEIARRFPQFEGLTDETGCYEPGGGYVRPERCIAAQLWLAQALGARVLTGPVERVSQGANGVTIAAGTERIIANRAVVAAGNWTAPLMGAPFDRLLTVNRQVLHWFPVTGADYTPGRFPTLIWLHGKGVDDSFYCFPALAGTGLFKAAEEQYRIPSEPDQIDRIARPEEAVNFHAAHIAGRLKGIAPVAARSAVCAYTVTPDSAFIIDGHPGMDRVTVISACSGHGFKHSAGVGEAAAEQIARGERHAVLPPFALSRFAAAGAR